jgi:hypothetical protein
MRFLPTTWHVLVGITTTAIILAMFHVAKTPFETVVISALVYIFTFQQATYIDMVNALTQIYDTFMVRYTRVGKALNLNTEMDDEALNEGRPINERIEKERWIDASFNYLFALIATVELIVAVVGLQS